MGSLALIVNHFLQLYLSFLLLSDHLLLNFFNLVKYSLCIEAFTILHKEVFLDLKFFIVLYCLVFVFENELLDVRFNHRWLKGRTQWTITKSTLPIDFKLFWLEYRLYKESPALFLFGISSVFTFLCYFRFSQCKFDYRLGILFRMLLICFI